MPQWAHKPNAIIHAELVTDPAMLDQLHTFCVNNPLPRWLWHAGDPPHPSRNQFQFYFDRGNDIVVALDQDNEIWAMRVNSRKEGTPGIWMHFRREEDRLHDPMPGEPQGGATKNSRESAAHMSALSWARAGSIQPMMIPGDGQNKNVARLDHDSIRNRAIELFNTVYGPQYGLV